MVSVPLGKSDWRRSVAKEAEIPVLNRYFEQNPTNLEEQAALLSRPGLRRFLDLGQGPIRLLYSQPGSFADALFAVGGENLYKIETNKEFDLVGTGIFGAETKSTPSMAATSRIGEVPEYLWIADGRTLWLFTENANARGRLTASGTIANGYKIQIDTTYYQWTTGSVDTGTPAGTVGSPWLVARGANNAEALGNMFDAINMTGTGGTTYSTALTEHPTVKALNYDTTTLVLQAKDYGTGGNLIATVVTSGANISFAAATLEDGGTPRMVNVPMPDDLAPISVAFIAGYIIVVCDQGQGVNGRFYWIKPGEVTIDPLDFATAERSPDPVLSVRAVGDQFWLLGSNSTEVWYPTGDADTPFRRVQGRLFDRGVWDGTDAQIKDFVMLVDSDGIVYQITDGGPQRVSNNSIEERIRQAIIAEQRAIAQAALLAENEV